MQVVHITHGLDEPSVCRAIPVAQLDEVLHSEPDQLGFIVRLPNTHVPPGTMLRRVLCQWQLGKVDRIRVECMNGTLHQFRVL